MNASTQEHTIGKTGRKHENVRIHTTMCTTEQICSVTKETIHYSVGHFMPLPMNVIYFMDHFVALKQAKIPFSGYQWISAEIELFVISEA